MRLSKLDMTMIDVAICECIDRSGPRQITDKGIHRLTQIRTRIFTEFFGIKMDPKDFSAMVKTNQSKYKTL